VSTIVSVTPLAVEADSRTFKEAASFARFGYRSVVVEGGWSSFDRADLPFELRSAGTPPPARTSGVIADRGPREARVAASVQALYAPLRFARATAREARRTGALLPAASLYVLHEFAQYIPVARACHAQGIGFVYDAHDVYSTLVSEHRAQPGYRASLQRLRNGIERLCVRDAAACITVGDGVAALCEKRFQRPFAVVRNAHDPRLDRRSKKSVRQAAGVDDEVFLVVTIGNAKPSIALPRTLAALARLPERVHLAGIGRGYERFAGEVERLGLAGRVHFVGPVAPVEVTSFARDADLAAVLYTATNASVFNALPNGFFQAVAAGLPMVHSPLPEITALAERYELGLVADQADPAAVAAQITRLVKDPASLTRFRENARRAAGALTWEREETRLAEVIAAALNTR
jgi:glycosyltransferase involved in cell wall biosynthesis